MKYGTCLVCKSPIIERYYKLKNTDYFKRFYSCKKTISHSYSEDELDTVDVNYHKNFFNEKMRFNV